MKEMQIRISLMEMNEPVWRSVLVEDDMTFRELHLILQLVMGWHNRFEFRFDAGDFYIGREDPEAPFPEGNTAEARTIFVKDYLNKVGVKMRYLYDFDYLWEHEIEVEKIGPIREDVIYPMCVAGDRSCPPEEAGGVDYYFYALDVRDYEDEEYYTEIAEWLPLDFDPDSFSLEDTNFRMSIDYDYGLERMQAKARRRKNKAF